MISPRQFLDVHLKPNYEDWLAAPLDERLAMNAVAAANNMAAWAVHYWFKRDLTQVYGFRADCREGEAKYRDQRAARECADLALVRDVAEAHEHFTLSRTSRKVTRSDQTGPGATGWGEGGFGEGVYGGGPQLVVTLNDGTKRPLTAIMANVIDMWDRLLTRWKLLSRSGRRELNRRLSAPIQSA
jgi:hypothetical protein